MTTKVINGRIKHKADITPNWNRATTFVPLEGEIIVYTDIYALKVGDGVTTVVDLPFVSTQLPQVTSEDDGKILKVVNGKWRAVQPE